ncbi:hypothetical protein [Spirosoma pollinicola]|uniref:Uncharacterized protein n=1 Tax=Spirosoma pollinicola TaxID=2057025 RepID=A0A2K8Z1T1_9BACT|nr:hypothetical protein [Spirosoma pollinicola]AUD03850.1 hypothetical protein CWM47_19670 [Spirosoma pollinicola]
MKTVLLFLLLAPTILWAQLMKITPQDTQRTHLYLLMRDGTTLRGRVIQQDSSIITVRKPNGDMSYVEADQVLSISANRPDTPAQLDQSNGTVFVLKDGTQLNGTFVRRDSTMITVRKSNGQLTYFEPELLVRVDTVRSAASSDGYSADGTTFQNPFPAWLLTGQTAFTPDKGRFYYRNTLVVLNEFGYGITRNWSVGASFITPITYVALVNFYALNGFLPNNSQLFTKLSVPLGNRFRVGLNVKYLDRYANTSSKRGPLTYQLLTSIGSNQRNVTLGFGLTDRGKQRYYVYSGVYPPSSPAYVDVHIPNQSFLTLGIMQKVSPYLTLISDNRINLGTNQYIYDDGSERVSTSFAFRLDRRRHAFDLGFYGLIYRNTDQWNGKQVRILPYLGYSVGIGGK